MTNAMLERLFEDAHTYFDWGSKPVSEATLRELYDLVKLAPTSMNCLPMRLVFITSPEAKARLLPCLMKGNVEKTKTAPVTALIAYDSEFYKKMDVLWPHSDVGGMFAKNAALAETTAFRNSSLQGGYLILAARALGLSCGPMSGFNSQQINDEFFANTTYKINFICNLGYGKEGAYHPRLPRLSFDEVATFV